MHFRVKSVSDGHHIKVKGLSPSSITGFSRSSAYQHLNANLNNNAWGRCYTQGTDGAIPADQSKWYELEHIYNAAGTELPKTGLYASVWQNILQLRNQSGSIVPWNHVEVKPTSTISFWATVGHFDFTQGRTSSPRALYFGDSSLNAPLYHQGFELVAADSTRLKIIGAYLADGTKVDETAAGLVYAWDATNRQLSISCTKTSLKFARIDFVLKDLPPAPRSMTLDEE